MATLITWRYQFEKGSIAIQATNFAILTSNNFIKTFGLQFIVFLLVLVIFLFILAITDKNLHSPTTMLLKRKKITFPIRLTTLFYNVMLLSSLIQVIGTNDIVSFQPFSFSIAILALIVIFIILISVGVVSNWKRFQVDDPHYYVLLEQMTSKKWYAKNNILISLVFRTLMIGIYVGMFSNSSAGGIIIIILQVIYTIYFIILIRFTKLRYLIFKSISHLLLIITLTISYVGSVSEIYGSSWDNSSLVYVLSLMAHVIFFFLITVAEIMFQKDRIFKYLRSFCSRFILCERLDDKIEISKYDESSHREKVREFHANLLYQKGMAENRSIEMGEMSRD